MLTIGREKPSDGILTRREFDGTPRPSNSTPNRWRFARESRASLMPESESIGYPLYVAVRFDQEVDLAVGRGILRAVDGQLLERMGIRDLMPLIPQRDQALALRILVVNFVFPLEARRLGPAEQAGRVSAIDDVPAAALVHAEGVPGKGKPEGIAADCGDAVLVLEIHVHVLPRHRSRSRRELRPA